MTRVASQWDNTPRILQVRKPSIGLPEPGILAAIEEGFARMSPSISGRVISPCHSPRSFT